MITLENLGLWFDEKEGVERKPSDDPFEVSNERAQELLKYDGAYAIVKEVKKETKSARKTSAKKSTKATEETAQTEVDAADEVTEESAKEEVTEEKVGE